MDVALYGAKTLVSVVAVVTVAGGVLADAVVPATARQHLRNPAWPPHAKFHNGQTILLGVLTGVLALGLTWFTGDQAGMFHVAVLVAALVWVSMLGAALLPGTRWTDPEFDPGPGDGGRGRRLGPPQMRLAVAMLVLLVLAEIVRPT